jgi:hypothetical protein
MMKMMKTQGALMEKEKLSVTWCLQDHTSRLIIRTMSPNLNLHQSGIWKTALKKSHADTSKKDLELIPLSNVMYAINMFEPNVSREKHYLPYLMIDALNTCASIANGTKMKQS